MPQDLEVVTEGYGTPTNLSESITVLPNLIRDLMAVLREPVRHITRPIVFSLSQTGS